MTTVAPNIQDAIRAAISFFEQLYRDKALKDVLLEEVREKDEDTWEVTIGYSRVVQDGPMIGSLIQGQGPKYERAYKSIAVNKETGQVKSMTIRTP